MDYEKAYKEALERARAGKPMNEVFPELHESEDEKIRKDLICEVQSWDGIPQSKREKYVAYLEKQKEQKSKQSEEEKEYVRTLKSLISDFVRAKNNYIDAGYYQLIYDWLDGRHIEQKPTECIDFDNEFENQVSHLIASVLNGEHEYSEGFVKYSAQSLLGYAKNELRPAEWSKEDEKYLNLAINIVASDFGEDSPTVSWLKSLRPQPHWKPSEEQMEWLESAVRLSTNKPHIHGIIISLYEQLKRL